MQASTGMTNLYFCRRRGISTSAREEHDLATSVLIGYPMPNGIDDSYRRWLLDAAHIHLDSVISALLGTEL
jgi:hypothetical protein